MQVAHAKDGKPEPATGEMFTGQVHRQPLLDKPQGTNLTLGLVKFSPGGRTKWHRHTFDQGLLIVEGKGIVATEDAEHVVEVGDAVIIPANEKHWHGGSETSGMAHISITQVGEAKGAWPDTKQVGAQRSERVAILFDGRQGGWGLNAILADPDGVMFTESVAIGVTQ